MIIVNNLNCDSVYLNVEIRKENDESKHQAEVIKG